MTPSPSVLAVALLAACAEGSGSTASGLTAASIGGTGDTDMGADGSTEDTHVGETGGADATDSGASGSTDVVSSSGMPPPLPSCDDAAMNGSETDVDCGGPCPPCGTGQSCVDSSDCDPGACEAGVC